MAIKKKRQAEGLNENDVVVLEYRRFQTTTMKYFVDALYFCNVEPVPLDELLKLLQLVYKMGFPEEVKGENDFECTAKEWLTLSKNVLYMHMYHRPGTYTGYISSRRERMTERNKS